MLMTIFFFHFLLADFSCEKQFSTTNKRATSLQRVLVQRNIRYYDCKKKIHFFHHLNSYKKKKFSLWSDERYSFKHTQNTEREKDWRKGPSQKIIDNFVSILFLFGEEQHPKNKKRNKVSK